MHKYFILVLLFIITSFEIFGSEPKLKTGFIYAKKGDSLEVLIKRNVPPGLLESIPDYDAWIKRIKTYNQSIVDFNNLEEGAEVYVELGNYGIKKSKVAVEKKVKKIKRIVKLKRAKRNLRIRLKGGEPIIKTKFIVNNTEQSLESFLINDIGFQKEELIANNIIEKVLEYNPGIDPSNVVIGEELYLEYPHRIELPEIMIKVAKSKKIKDPVEKKIKSEIKPREKTKKENIFIAKKIKKEKRNILTENRFSLSSFYMASAGTFNETLSSGASLSSQQNSPFSFGAAWSMKPNVSGSVYLSYLNGAAASNTASGAQEITIPPEFGFNTYYNYKLSSYLNGIIGGIDFESFSTFNTDELNAGASLTTREHRIIYLTLGMDKITKVWNYNTFIRFSIAKSLLTRASRKSTINSDEFSGLRYTFYLNFSKGSNWYYHFLYKLHSMSGPTELTISRYGIGLGYRFF